MLTERNQKPKFELCELRGGPHHGQTVNLPNDQDVVTFHDDGTPHQYHRLSIGPIFHHEAKVAEMFGGKVRLPAPPERDKANDPLRSMGLAAAVAECVGRIEAGDTFTDLYISSCIGRDISKVFGELQRLEANGSVEPVSRRQHATLWRRLGGK